MSERTAMGDLIREHLKLRDRLKLLERMMLEAMHLMDKSGLSTYGLETETGLRVGCKNCIHQRKVFESVHACDMAQDFDPYYKMRGCKWEYSSPTEKVKKLVDGQRLV